MTYIDAMQPDLSAIACDEIANGDGTFAYRKKTTGKILSLDIFTGKWIETDNIGSWESFKKSSTALVLDLEWKRETDPKPIRYTFLRPFVEA